MKSRILIIALLLVSFLGVGAYLGDRTLKSKGHAGLKKFLHQCWVNYPASFAVEPEVVELTVDQSELDALENVVAAARDRGVIMRDGNDYVSAEFTAGGSTFKVKVRIKGKMADHVKGDKWSFRVLARKDKGFKGMQRFSLQHPGTRNYLCDWFFHRLMRGEGMVALRYGFVNLQFNGEDLGVYAYEEHFGPELLANNDRVKGPLFRFDPGLFWEHRLNMIEKVRYNEAFAPYQAAAVDAFGSSDLEKDSVQRGYFEEAVGLMMAFRRGDRKASEVFNTDLIAKRHAVLDLVGGHHSMDWSDVKFYYDPIIKRIEPVAYESFSAFPIRTLAGADRYVGHISQSMDLHDAYFNDPEVFAAYVHQLEKVSAPAYLDSAFTALAPALDSAAAILYREFPYKELDRDLYRRNQLVIRRMLDVPKGFHAYGEAANDTLRLTIVPIESLPIEVFGVVGTDGRVLSPEKRTIVPIRRAGNMGSPIDLRIALDDAWRKAPPQKLELSYAVLGAGHRKTLEVYPYALTDGLALPAFTAPVGYAFGKESFIRIDEASRSITILPGVHRIERDVFVPSGYTVNASAPLQFDLLRGARIVSRSPLQWVGMEEAPIILRSTDASGGGLVLLSTGGKSRFEHVRVEGFGVSAQGTAAVILQEAPAQWISCDLGEARTRDLLLAVRSEVGIIGSTFTGGADQLKLVFGNASLEDLDMRGAGDDAIVVKGGNAVITRTVVATADGSALALDENATTTVEATSLGAIKDAVEVSEGARLVMKGGRIGSAKAAAIDVKALHARHGASTVEIHDTTIEAAVPPKVGKGNQASLNGKSLEATSAAP